MQIARRGHVDTDALVDLLPGVAEDPIGRDVCLVHKLDVSRTWRHDARRQAFQEGFVILCDEILLRARAAGQFLDPTGLIEGEFSQSEREAGTWRRAENANAAIGARVGDGFHH